MMLTKPPLTSIKASKASVKLVFSSLNRFLSLSTPLIYFRQSSRRSPSLCFLSAAPSDLHPAAALAPTPDSPLDIGRMTPRGIHCQCIPWGVILSSPSPFTLFFHTAVPRPQICADGLIRRTKRPTRDVFNLACHWISMIWQKQSTYQQK